ncbi:MAG: hypothetical protein A2Y40_02800 [Candidatus Margulisbacteria bacterium GWF2_35_9]|nr:MAG: hypothetical protein A2Y40_02800 [Candidatus Margulisbacteria bacterium GWF2_35_9]
MNYKIISIKSFPMDMSGIFKSSETIIDTILSIWHNYWDSLGLSPQEAYTAFDHHNNYKQNTSGKNRLEDFLLQELITQFSSQALSAPTAMEKTLITTPMNHIRDLVEFTVACHLKKEEKSALFNILSTIINTRKDEPETLDTVLAILIKSNNQINSYYTTEFHDTLCNILTDIYTKSDGTAKEEILRIAKDKRMLTFINILNNVVKNDEQIMFIEKKLGLYFSILDTILYALSNPSKLQDVINNLEQLAQLGAFDLIEDLTRSSIFNMERFNFNNLISTTMGFDVRNMEIWKSKY